MILLMMTTIELEPGFFAQVHHFFGMTSANIAAPADATIRRIKVSPMNDSYQVQIDCERNTHPMKEADIAPLERARTLLRMWSTGYDCPHLEPYLEHCLVCETKRFIGAI
jgi:hypothetical protein